jgi:transposase
MSPVVRRGWRPRNSPSVLLQRTRSHKKVSAIAALCVPPTRDRVRLTFRLHPDGNVDSPRVIEFLQHLQRHLSGPIVLLWDGLNAHRSHLTRAFLSDHPDIHVFPFPPYAPEINPVEYLWSYLKVNPLANLALLELSTLADATRRASRSVQRRPNLLRSFLAHSPLSLRLE